MTTASKIGWHVQYWEKVKDWLPPLVDRCGVRYVKVMDPPEWNPFAFAETVGRAYLPDEQTNAMIAQGKHGAWLWWQAARPIIYKAIRYVKKWTGPNEPHPPWDSTFLKALNVFTMELAHIVGEEGIQLLGLNMSVSWPQLSVFKSENGTPFPNDVEYLAPCIDYLARKGHYLCLHEYCAPIAVVKSKDGNFPWTGRFQHLYDELSKMLYIKLPKLFIGECVLDGGVYVPVLNENPRKVGYKDLCPPAWNAEQYHMEQIGVYDDLLRTNKYADLIEAAFIFGTGAGPDWESFAWEESGSTMMADYIEHKPPVENREPDAWKPLDITRKLPYNEKIEPTCRELASIDRVVIHHAGAGRRAQPRPQLYARTIRHVHVDGHGWPSIGYHFLVVMKPDGTVVVLQTLPLNRVGYHAGKYSFNRYGIGIMMSGNNTLEDDPTDAQVEAICDLLCYLKHELGRELTIKAHKQVVQTTCPGPDLRRSWWQRIKSVWGRC